MTMRSACVGCKYADWKRTRSGKMHPSGEGRCTYMKRNTLDIRIPAAFFWVDGSQPTPVGGRITRRDTGNVIDVCWFRTEEDGR
jgi:hypothetical protein